MTFFILLSKTNKINIYFQLLRDRKKELSIKIDPKTKSKTTNRFSKQFSRTNVIISHSSTFEVKKKGGGPRHGSSNVFLIGISNRLKPYNRLLGQVSDRVPGYSVENLFCSV